MAAFGKTDADLLVEMWSVLFFSRFHSQCWPHDVHIMHFWTICRHVFLVSAALVTQGSKRSTKWFYCYYYYSAFCVPCVSHEEESQSRVRRYFVGDQGRYHVFKVGGLVPWSRVLLPFYRKKIRQVYPVWCSRLHNQLFIKKLREKLGGPSKFWGSGPPNPRVVAPMWVTVTSFIYTHFP